MSCIGQPLLWLHVLVCLAMRLLVYFVLSLVRHGRAGEASLCGASYGITFGDFAPPPTNVHYIHAGVAVNKWVQPRSSAAPTHSIVISAGDFNTNLCLVTEASGTQGTSGEQGNEENDSTYDEVHRVP